MKNLLEELVNKQLDEIYQRNLDVCKCQQCKMDVIALTLNQLPPLYITGTRGTESARKALYTKYHNKLPQVLMDSIKKVKEKPRPECAKTQSNIFTQNSFLTYYRP